MRCYLALGLMGWLVAGYTLNLDEFVPNFLATDKVAESGNLDSGLRFKSAPANKPKSSSSMPYSFLTQSAEYGKAQLGGSESATLISGNGIIPVAPNVGANDSYINRNSNVYDANAVANFNLTNSNQSTMQSYSAKLNNFSPETTLKNNFAIPLKPDGNTEVNIGVNQLQFMWHTN